MPVKGSYGTSGIKKPRKPAPKPKPRKPKGK